MNHSNHSNHSRPTESLPTDSNKKRRFRFSLSTFLVVFTVIAGVLGVWLSLIQPTRVQWNAIRPLLERGARVETSPSDVPAWVKRFLPKGETENVIAVQIIDQLHSRDIERLRDLPHLKRLNVERCGLIDKDVEQISQLQSLERLLLLENGKLTNACAKHVIRLENLKFVDIHRTGMDWRACHELKKRSDLEVKWGYSHTFKANGTELDSLAMFFPVKVHRIVLTNPKQDSISYAVSKFKNLSVIHVDRILPITTDKINSIADSIDGKLAIRFDGCKDIDDVFFETISDCFRANRFCVAGKQASLRIYHRNNSDLSIHLDNLTDQLVQRFSNHFIFGDILACEFRGSDEATIYQFVKHFRNLKDLRFSRCTFASFDAWSGSKLKTISFEDCENLQSIKGLSSFESLERLEVSKSPLSSIDLGRAGDEDLNLKSISLHALPSFQEFQSLSKFKTLTELSIDSCGLLKDISWITGLQELETVDVTSCPIKRVENLKSMPSLKELNFDCCEELNRFVDCDFAAVTRLAILNGDKIHNFRPFENITGLTNLALDSIRTCQNVEQLSSLENLWLSGPYDSIESIDGLERLPNLKTLTLHARKLHARNVGINDADQTLAKLAETLNSFSSRSVLLQRVFQSHQRKFRDKLRESTGDSGKKKAGAD